MQKGAFEDRAGDLEEDSLWGMGSQTAGLRHMASQEKVLHQSRPRRPLQRDWH
jgi:hypothetical protein